MRSLPSSVTTPMVTASSPHFAEDAENFVFPALFGDQQHALLGFGEQHFVGRHAGFALRDQVEIDIDADAAAAAHFAG
jgi:hypothetical protein